MRPKPTDVELTPLTPDQLEIFDKIKDGYTKESFPVEFDIINIA